MNFKLLFRSTVIFFIILWIANTINSQTGCGGTYTGSSGTISSPNYPNSYANNLNCTYNIVLSSQNSVNITFLAFSVESCCDWLQVYCSLGSSKSSPRFSGKVLPPFLSIKSCSRVTLAFYSDSTTPDQGFSLRYDIGDGIMGGFSVKPTNVFISRDSTSPIVLSCTSSVNRPSAYPWWTFSQDGSTFTLITSSDCSLFSPQSSTKYSVMRQSPSNGCNLIIFTTYLSAVVGIYTCTESTLESTSALLFSLTAPSLTSVPDLSSPSTEPVQGDSVRVTCNMVEQLHSPFVQLQLSLHSLDFNVTSSASSGLSRLISIPPIVLPSINCDILITGFPSNCATNQPSNFSVSIPARQVSYWPDAERTNITGTSNGHVTKNSALVCYSSAYPPPNYHWTYEASGVRTEGPVVIVTHSGIYTCTAENLIKGTNHQASKSIDVTIEDAVVEFNLTALIVGIVLGSAVLVLLVIVIVTCACLLRRKESSQVSMTTVSTTDNISNTQSAHNNSKYGAWNTASDTRIGSTRNTDSRYSNSHEVAYDNVAYTHGENEHPSRGTQRRY